MIVRTRTRKPGASRDAGGIGGPLAGLLFTTAIAGAGRLAKDPFPAPGSSAEVIRTYYSGSARAARFNVGLQALSILAQARYVAAMVKVASQHPSHPRPLAGTVLLSGGASVALLAASATIQGSLTAPKERTDAELLATTQRVFVSGGPVHGLANSVFTAATAVAARDTGLLGRTGARLSPLSAVANLLTPAYFRWEPAGWLIPIGRFSSYILSGVVGTRLAAKNGSNPAAFSGSSTAPR